MMFVFGVTQTLVVLIGLCTFDAALLPSYESSSSYPFTFVSREAWGAAPPSKTIPLFTPVPIVVLHHTYIPGACLTRDECSRSMRSMQAYHQGKGWGDFGYNFAIGGDEAVYEGRGWSNVGSHAVGYNSKSIGIAIIGDYVQTVPPEPLLVLARHLISWGIENGYISLNYALVGHRQLSATDCPGTAFYNEIMKWDHYNETIKADFSSVQ